MVDALEGTPWSDTENDLIVADYLAMLRLELCGQSLNKAAHNRDLQAKIRRSRGSIERKHENISAILVLFSQPFIFGYKPLPAYQHSLLDALRRQLPDMLVEYVPPPIDPVAAASFVPPPTLRPSNERLPDFLRTAISKTDPALRDQQMRTLGLAGEQLVFDLERRRLQQHQPNLVNDLEWTSRDRGDGYGYDIRSFDERGKEMFLEVKTTRGTEQSPFFLTRNEADVADEKGTQFRLRRVFQFGPRPLIFDLTPPLADHVRLDTAVFRASFN